MSSIQSLLESANPWKSLQSDAGRLATKWAKTGLLEGLGETDKNNMALMLENQAKQLVTENSTTSTTNNTFTVGTGENWAGIALPLVRKVFGQIAAKEFVSVQPMNLPSGLVFFLDFQYGNNKAPFTQGGSMYGNRSSATYPFATPATEGGLYGAGRFGYSINNTSSAVTAASGSTSWATTFNFDSNYSASFGQWKTYTVTLPAATDLEAVRSFVPFSGSAAIDYLPAFTSTNGTTVTFVVTGSTVIAAAPTITVSHSLATADNKRGDFEDGNTQLNGQNNPISIPEINVKMVSQAIVAKTRKLKAVWTPEYAQDLSAYQNIDAEAELTNIMSEYISMEIDLEILDMLIEDAAAGTEYWSAINNNVINSTGTAFEAPTSTSQTGFYNTQGGWFQTLGTKVQKLSNKIHQLTLRGGANFLVCSPTVATIFESIPGFAANNNGDAAQMQYAFGVQKAGSLNGRYNIYKNPYMTENVILLGFRGSQFLEAGAVFAPYVPLVMTPLVYDPETFTPRKGLLTRYAKKMLRPEFYGKIYVSGLNTI
jgi:hypothetical protein